MNIKYKYTCLISIKTWDLLAYDFTKTCNNEHYITNIPYNLEQNYIFYTILYDYDRDIVGKFSAIDRSHWQLAINALLYIDTKKKSHRCTHAHCGNRTLVHH